MFGALRFVLASLVVLTHAGMVFGSFRPGPTAVIGFYLISGFVICALIDRRWEAMGLRGFYTERAFRIYPQFAAHLLVSIAFLAITGHVSRLTEIRPDLGSVLINASLLPLQFRAFSEELTAMLYVPTSWSLSLEASFYLVAPFLLRSKLQDVIAWISFGAFALAVLDLAPGRPHTISYATIIGTLHFFVVGAWLQRGEHRKALVWAGLMAALAVAVTAFASWRESHVEEVFVGGLAGAAAVYLLSRVDLSAWRKVDDWLGRVSYPVFLNHFLLIWTFELLGRAPLGPADWVLILLSSWILGFIAYAAIEHPTHAFRRRLRTRRRDTERTGRGHEG